MIWLKFMCSIEFPFQGFDITVLEPGNDYGGADNHGIRGNNQMCLFRIALVTFLILAYFSQEMRMLKLPQKH